MIAPPAPAQGLVVALRAAATRSTPTDGVADALGEIARSLALDGLRLRIASADPLPTLDAGWGTLASSNGAPADRDGEGEHPTDRVWSDGDVEAGRLAVATVVSAIEAARAHVRADRARAHLEALDAALTGIAGGAAQPVEEVLQLIVDGSRELAGARYAALGIVDEQGAIEAFLTSGIDDETRSRIGALPRGHGLLGLIIREGATFRIPDIETDPRRHGFPPNHPQMHSFLGVPVRAAGVSVGNLYLTEKIGHTEFSTDDQELVERFALHAGIAIDTARLHRRLQELVVVEERERIGRDLHDSVIQRIYGVGLSLDDVPSLIASEPEEASSRVDAAIDSLNSTIREIREFIFTLNAASDETGGLADAIGALATEMQMQTGVTVEVSLDDPAPFLGEDGRIQLLAILREGMANVARHAHAHRVGVQLRGDDSGAALRISDDGDGFDPSTPPEPGHHGLGNMRRRAEGMGGTFEIESVRGDGTRIIVWLPSAGQGHPSIPGETR